MIRLASCIKIIPNQGCLGGISCWCDRCQRRYKCTWIKEFPLNEKHNNLMTHTWRGDCCGRFEMSYKSHIAWKMEVEHFINEMSHKPNVLRFWIKIQYLTHFCDCFWVNVRRILQTSLLWSSINVYLDLDVFQVISTSQIILKGLVFIVQLKFKFFSSP